MRNVFKRFGVKDTGSFRDEYFRTRIALTAIYTGILVILLVLSSGITRSVFSERLSQRFALVIDQNDRIHPVVFPVNVENVTKDLSDTLMLVNGILVFVSVFVSYRLATRTLKPIEDAYERQRQFLSDASHELRTPLAILQANLENERDSGSAELRASAVSHLEEVARMSTLVRDVLSLSKLEHAGSSSARVPIILNDILETVVSRLSSIAKNNHVSLTLEDASETFTVLAAEEPFIRALTNLVENAIVYNKRDGTVTISARRDGEKVCITVEDSGVGISETDVQKIFDRFYRADKSRSRRTGGSGLGLSIARTIIESFGGSVTMTSVVDVGTTVLVRLPIHSAS